MRAVFDTNVIVSALLVTDSKPRKALDRGLAHGKILLSLAVQTELYEVLNLSRLRRYISEEDIHVFLAALTAEAQWVEVDIELSVCRDSRDDKFLELAVCGHATHLITGDSDLLILNPFQGVAILNPADFLQSSLLDE